MISMWWIIWVFNISQFVKFQTTAASIVSYEGGTVTLTCTESPTIYPEWSGPYISPYNYPQDPEFSFQLGEKKPRLSWDPTNNKNLIINNVMKNDTGTYTCSYNMNNEVKFRKLDLSVRVLPQPPVINNTETPDGTTTVVRGTEGQKLTLQCTSTGGYPEPLLDWYKGNTQTQPFYTTKTSQEGSDGTFTVEVTHTFTPSNQDDDVTFVCQSSFSPPQPSKQRVQIQLLLILKPSPPMVTSYPVVEGVSGKVAECRTSGFRPDNIDVWFQMNGNNVTSYTAITGNTGQTFSAVASHTATLQRQQNGKPLVCYFAHQTLQTPLNGSGTTNVRFRPVSASLTGTVSNIVAESNAKIILTCSSGTANPKSTITWHRDGVQITNQAAVTESTGDYNGVVTSQILEFVPDRSMDGARVYCTVQNNVTTNRPPQSVTKVLYLSYHPIVQIKGNTEIKEGQTMSLKCEADAKPYPIFTWYLNGNPIHADSSNDELVIDAANRTHGGQYTCKAANGVAPNGIAHTNVTIKCPPETPYSVLIEDVQSSSVTISWLPGFHGGFDQTFTIEYSDRTDEWLQVNIPGDQHENRFNKTIRGLQTRTKYFFRIKSANERGTSDYSYTLNATTKVIETTSPTSNLSGIIGGASAGIVVFVVGIVALTVIRKRKSKSNDGSLHQIPVANAAFRDNGSTGVQHDGMVCDYYNMNRETYESLEYTQGHGHEYDVLGQRPLYEDLRYTNDSSHQYGTLDNVKEDQPVSNDGKMYENLRLSPLK